MILYIITDTYENALSHTFWRHKFIFEKAADDTCIHLHYTQVTQDVLKRIEPWAILHSGGSAEYSTYDVLQHEEYRRVVLESSLPQIGFCGGHQIIASMFGSSLGHMRPLRDGETDANSSYHSGLYKEWGIQEVQIIERDPLFEGLPDVIKVPEYHMDEVKEMSADLKLLATNGNCRVQSFVHRHKMIYGTQFHPEEANDENPDGRLIVENFFRLARKQVLAK